MTFTEAAVEVLRRTGKPLHYRKITELAIQLNLLSHVGKTPEVTMSSRLATLVKKDRGESPIIKVKPGVFGLRDFGKEVIEAAAVEIPDDPHAAAEEAALEAASGDGEEGLEIPSLAPGGESLPPDPKKEEQKQKAKSKPLPGSDVFPEEEDDDEPILGGPEKKDEEGGEEGREGGRRGRRRRRRRGGEEREGREGGNREEREPREGRENREGREGREGRDGNRGGRDREERGATERIHVGESRHHGAALSREAREELLRADPNREAAEGELAGKDLADAVFTVMTGIDRNPQTFTRICEQLVRRGRLQGDAAALVPTVAAAVRADVARREAEAIRPRFRVMLGRVSLTDWALSPEAIRFEQDAVRAADRQRDQVRQAFLRRMRELPGAGFAELLATWLNAEGVVSLRAVRRPGAQPGELHLAGTFKRGHDEVRLAIMARRDGREINRERVIEMRGALHHYGSASMAWLITSGPVLSGAREEAVVPGTAPCSLFDGTGLARAMERVGVGLRRHVIPVATLDLDLLESLRGIDPLSREERDQREGRTSEPREEREGGRRRDRDGRRERGERNENNANAEGAEAQPQEATEGAGEENEETRSLATDVGNVESPENQGDFETSDRDSDAPSNEEGDSDAPHAFEADADSNEEQGGEDEIDRDVEVELDEDEDGEEA